MTTTFILLIYCENKYLLNYFQFQIIIADYGQKVGMSCLKKTPHTEKTNSGLTTVLLWFTTIYNKPVKNLQYATITSKFGQPEYALVILS